MTDTVVNSLASAYTAFTSAANGDRVLLQDGTYDVGGSDHNLTKSSSSAVVKFMAQNRGGAILTGNPINLTSNNIIFEGFDLQYSLASGSYVDIDGDGCQMTRNKIHLGNGTGDQKWVTSNGNNVLFDHNEIYGKTSVDDMFLAQDGTGCRVMYNYFHDFEETSSTKSEPVRFGNSNLTFIDFNGECAYNLFEGLNADVEVISIKCTNVKIHHNTLINSNGSIVLRQAYNCHVYNNYLEDCGIRFYGSGHIIERNKIVNVTTGGTSVNRAMYIASATVEDIETAPGSGIPGTPGVEVALNSEEARVKNCIIRNNHFSNGNSTSGILMVMGSDATKAFQPTGNVFSGNIMSASTGTLADAISGTFSADWTLNSTSGNILTASGSASVGDMPAGGYVTSSDHKQCLLENLQDVIKLRPADVGVDAP